MLEQKDKELAAIGASIGANCRPCIEHHIPAGHEAGLSDRDLSDAVATAAAVRQEANEKLSARASELLGDPAASPIHDVSSEPSAARELVALGASVGANAHALLRRHIASALEAGLSTAQVRTAVNVAEHVQRRAGEITTEKAARALDELTDQRSASTAAQEPVGC
jgi:AhpD family alkylhydroperoxidase